MGRTERRPGPELLETGDPRTSVDPRTSSVGCRETVYRVEEQHAAWRQAGQECVVLDLSNSVYYGLNASAGMLWQRLLSGATQPELVDLLAKPSMGTSHEQIVADVAGFVAELQRQGLLSEYNR